MKPRISYVLLICIFLQCCSVAYGQQNRYNISINNGLPSNNAYYTLKDREGYLWIATDKGVVRYNGYDFKLFDLSSGIGNDDIWHMYEDKKGRIWLSSITNELGYIKNDQYHRAFVKSAELPFYPIYISENEAGIFFLSISHGAYLCQEKNDTITCLPINIPGSNVYLRKDGVPVVVKDGIVRTLTIKDNRLIFNNTCYQPSQKNYCPYYLYNNYLVPFPYKASDSRLLRINDITNCREWNITLERDENIYMLNVYKGSCYLTGNKSVYRLNDSTGIRKILSVNDIQGHKFKENDILTVIEDNVWGQCITTATDGVYINYGESKFSPVYENEMMGYRYVGSSADSNNYWWSKSKRTLARWDKNGVAHFQKHADILDVMKIAPSKNNNSIVLANNNIFTIKGDRMTDFYNGIRKVTVIQKTDTSIRKGKSGTYTPQKYPRLFNDFVAGMPGEFCFLRTGGGCGMFKVYGDSISIIFADEKIYRHVAYDSLRKVYWVYSNNIVSVLGSKAFYEIDKHLLDQLNIKKIENILIDERYGNVFLKCNDRLLLCDVQNRCVTELYKNYNLKGAVMLIDNGRLIIGGKFGVLYSKIDGRNHVSLPKLYANIKNVNYSYVNDMYLSNDGNLILNTNDGVLTAPIAANMQANSMEAPYLNMGKIIVHYHDSSYVTGANNTIVVSPNDPVLQPDIVNPMGNGIVRYKYKVDGVDMNWNSLNDEKIYLHGLVPGHLYTLSIMANDDAWKGSPVTFTVQIMPRWWQSTSGRRVVWVMVILSVLLSVMIIILITRNIVTRRHVKENMQLELNNLHLALELKSIYAQINPHFIFNTLSTALYFIKKRKFEEAYEHVSAFSDLLRSYIKSSRNKFISLAEEIENLEHYILLQQARFVHKFVHLISVEDTILISATQIPSLLLQPLVENAINHGLLHKEDEPGYLHIQFKRDEKENTLICIIDDNGIGREKAKQYRDESRVKTPSYGNDLIRELVNILNRTGQVNIDLQYTDKSAPMTGTTVTITIKIINKV